jgi:predicted secreted hydrolase
MKNLFVALFLSVCSLAFGQEYSDVSKDYQLTFPDALYYKKDFRIQWWYFTGHLFDQTGREFGYELTFFIVNVQKKEYASRFGVNTVYISHFALTDTSGNSFHFSDNADTGAYGFAGAKDDRLNVWIDNNVMEGTIGKMHVKASDEYKSFDLVLVPAKPFILNGENGYLRKSEESPLIASLYFSCPRLTTEGDIRIGARVFRVKGESWFDREILSRELSAKQEGWDWFSIRLDDNREMMLYLLRNKDGTTSRYSSGTFIYADGKSRHLSMNDFSINVLAFYTSKKTGARYPAKWGITVPSENLTLTLTPLLENQEVLAYRSTGNYYWEGTCKVHGSATGRAYVEMTGY